MTPRCCWPAAAPAVNWRRWPPPTPAAGVSAPWNPPPACWRPRAPRPRVTHNGMLPAHLAATSAANPPRRGGVLIGAALYRRRWRQTGFPAAVGAAPPRRTAAAVRLSTGRPARQPLPTLAAKRRAFGGAGAGGDRTHPPQLAPMAAARSRLLWQKVASPRLSGCAVRWASSFHCSTAVAEGGIPRSVSRQNSNALRLTPAPSQQTPLQPAQRTYGCPPGAQPAADGVKQHVAAHQPAVRLRVRAEDHALVQHVDRPPARSSSTMPATSQTRPLPIKPSGNRPASTAADTRRWPPAPARDPPDARRAPPPARPPRRPGRTPPLRHG